MVSRKPGEVATAGSAAQVVLSERQQEVLRNMSTATTLAKRLAQRATIILLAFAGLSNEGIARRVGLERHRTGCSAKLNCGPGAAVTGRTPPRKTRNSFSLRFRSFVPAITTPRNCISARHPHPLRR